jgi:hypothetical protein
MLRRIWPIVKVVTYACRNLKVAAPTVAPDRRVEVTVGITNAGPHAGEG